MKTRKHAIKNMKILSKVETNAKQIRSLIEMAKAMCVVDAVYAKPQTDYEFGLNAVHDFDVDPELLILCAGMKFVHGGLNDTEKNMGVLRVKYDSVDMAWGTPEKVEEVLFSAKLVK